MASAAQQYFNSIPPDEQQRVQASLNESGSSLDQWFQAAVNAGVPGAVRAAGGQSVAEPDKGYTGEYLAAEGNTADWKGKRPPTPRELRAYAKEAGWSEDFARFSDTQVAAWLRESWDVGASAFKSENHDGSNSWRGEKPTDGPLSTAAQHMRMRGPGGGGGMGPGGKGQNFQQQLGNGLYDPANPLQNQLVGMAQRGQLYGQDDQKNPMAMSLQGGGIWTASMPEKASVGNSANTGIKSGGGGGVFQRAQAVSPVAPPAATPAGPAPVNAAMQQNFGGGNPFKKRPIVR